ncbi:uncharacterized protein Dana_GF27629 [Drosophila ananassae]|uniref:Uncharacterized protein n=1 Tax=Drosophila ananassae TaxID=7217 RepID=A0A0N8P1I6_DROAN|nr:uncharacterized protein LOC26515038 [Drosophila ananassae]KPU80028.1 uncharacterized protein Dana_GF27629 [Drosophila ananassae]
MTDPWQEFGMHSSSRTRKHAKILQAKKRVARCRKKFRKNQEILMELHLRNRIKKFIIEHLEHKLGMLKGKA